jgi:hypothetical protein
MFVVADVAMLRVVETEVTLFTLCRLMKNTESPIPRMHTVRLFLAQMNDCCIKQIKHQLSRCLFYHNYSLLIYIIVNLLYLFYTTIYWLPSLQVHSKLLYLVGTTGVVYYQFDIGFQQTEPQNEFILLFKKLFL